MRDRLFINLKYREGMLKKWDAENTLGMHLLETKDIFLLATALGLNEPKDIDGKKDGYVRLSYIKTYHKSLIASILLGLAENKENVDAFANADVNYDEAERCAEAGFLKLNELIESFKFSNEELEVLPIIYEVVEQE